MFEHSVPTLRAACIGLGFLVLLQLLQLATRKDPLAGVRVPRAIAATASAAPTKLTAAAPPGGVAHEPDLKPPPTLPASIQARVDRVVASELLGPVPRPVSNPAALVGIAGQDALIRTPNGQVGLVRAGEEFNGIKVLQIGTNRVVVEEGGNQKELTIFSGFGSESLLPRGKEKAP